MTTCLQKPFTGQCGWENTYKERLSTRVLDHTELRNFIMEIENRQEIDAAAMI